MYNFDGKKFFGENVKVVERNSWTGKSEVVDKTVFHMTPNYRKYLQKKEEHKREVEFVSLCEKLKYEYEHYGEVDDIDWQLFKGLLKEYGYKG